MIINPKSQIQISKHQRKTIKLIGNWKSFGVAQDGELAEPLEIGNSRQSRAGFTLLELLIVMAILGTLAGLFITNFPASQKRARDARRKSDIKQYQTAMEVFANRNNGNYLNLAGLQNPASHCGSTEFNITGCPDDPLSSQHYGMYTTSTNYVIFATLEAKPNPPAITAYFVTCSTGISKEVTTPPTGSTCP